MRRKNKANVLPFLVVVGLEIGLKNKASHLERAGRINDKSHKSLFGITIKTRKKSFFSDSQGKKSSLFIK